MNYYPADIEKFRYNKSVEKIPEVPNTFLGSVGYRVEWRGGEESGALKLGRNFFFFHIS